MSTIAVNAPRTPVTEGSSGTAVATLPNVCKMPGPPAPFVPTPLPNVGKSGESPEGYSKTVKFEGTAVAIQGASFGSKGDEASKGTGGGIVSSNTQGPTKFLAPGSFDVKVEGKNVQLHGDQMLNNCGPGGGPPNSATMMGMVNGVMVVPIEGLGDLNCPHPNMVKDDPKDAPAKRKEVDDKIKNLRAKATERRAEAKSCSGVGDTEDAKECVRLATEWERAADAAEFEQKVDKDTNAREVSKKFRCPDCLMNGEIDVVTEKGVLKECATGKGDKSGQIKKLQSAAAVLFPGSSVHIATPQNALNKTKGVTFQRH